MIFELHCGDVLPGCPAHFEADSRERLLRRVTEHAAEAHQLTEPTPEQQRAVEAALRTRQR